jgi:hypothetical protein
MIVRFPWRKWFLGALSLVLIGCEPHHSFLRDNDDDDKVAKSSDSDDSDSKKVIGSTSDEQDTSSFWKSTRRYGGLSPEANSIERDLGVSND